MVPTPGWDFRTAAGRSLVDSPEVLERVSHLLAEEEPVERRPPGRGASAVPRVKGAPDPAIDESMVRLSVVDAGRAREAGCAEDRPIASGKPPCTLGDRVPGEHDSDGGGSVHAADGDADPVSGGRPRRSNEPPLLSRSVTTPEEQYLRLLSPAGQAQGQSVKVSVEALLRMERFFAAEKVAPDAAGGQRQGETEHGALLMQAAFRSSSSTRHTRTPARRVSGLGAQVSQGMKTGVRSGASDPVVDVKVRGGSHDKTNRE